MDDSGKLSKKEKCFSFGGIYFVDKIIGEKLRNDMKQLIYLNKCRFCNNNLSCDFDCLEIKSNNTNLVFRKKVLNLISDTKDIYSYAITIYNKNVDNKFFLNKKSKGRLIEYYQKIVIKEIVKKLLLYKLIDKGDSIVLKIIVDKGKMNSNGLYSLKDSVLKELTKGMGDFYSFSYFPPILFGDVVVLLNFVDSKKNYLIQASDFVVGHANGCAYHNKKSKYLYFHLKNLDK